MNILQYESKIWATADLLRGCGIKESEWPSFMMPFFALVMIESRLIRMFDELKAQEGAENVAMLSKDDLRSFILDRGQGYNTYIFERNQNLAAVCKNDKSFEIDLDGYLHGFDGETKDLLGVDAVEKQEFLNIKGKIAVLKAKKVLLSYTKLWSEIDLKPFDNAEITTLEEHIKRKWADISAETAGEHYTPDDVIALIAEIVASKITESDTLLKIYDCTCGGGNLLFGVEDRINRKSRRFTQAYGQDWNHTLYALAKIESRFRSDAKIAYGNTLVDDKYDDNDFDVVVANPPYGVSWKGYDKDIWADKTGRFNYIPSISDGQLLFMQHLVSKMAAHGVGVVVHNGSTLFSGDAGSAESNIRKWLLDQDLVEALIQLPTDEFFNTGIYTYLWVLNKKKAAQHKGKVMLINASEKFKPLKKSKGSKRKEVDEANRLEIVTTLTAFEDCDYAKVFDKHFFYFNKQAIVLTNVDEQGQAFDPQRTPAKLNPIALSNGERELRHFHISSYDKANYASLSDYYERDIRPFIDGLDYKEQNLVVTTAAGRYYFDGNAETLMFENDHTRQALGCGKIEVKCSLKAANARQAAHIKIGVELLPDTQKDYEIIPFCPDPAANQAAIAAFMARYVSKPFEYGENVVGVEINFNKVFYKPEKLRGVHEVLAELATLEAELKTLEAGLGL